MKGRQGTEPETKRQADNGIWLIVLAAGHATRMGTPKMLLPVNGEEMLKGIIKKALSEVDQVAVVLRREGHAEEVMLADLPVTLLKPSPGASVMSDSLKTAIQFCIEVKAEAAIILLGDQPDVEPTVARQLIDMYVVTKKSIIQPKYWDGPGHPILFDHFLFPDLLEVTGDQGARELLKRHSSRRLWITIDKNKPKDIDTPEDYQTYLRSKGFE